MENNSITQKMSQTIFSLFNGSTVDEAKYIRSMNNIRWFAHAAGLIRAAGYDANTFSCSTELRLEVPLPDGHKMHIVLDRSIEVEDELFIYIRFIPFDSLYFEDVVQPIFQNTEALHDFTPYRALCYSHPLPSTKEEVWDFLCNISCTFVSKIKEKQILFDGISTGFAALDHVLGGWKNQELIIIAGRPSIGKTTFYLSMALHLAAIQNIPVGIFSLVETHTQLLKKFDTLGANISVLSDAHIYIDDTPHASAATISEKITQWVSQYGVKCIVIDYLQLLSGAPHCFCRSDELLKICQEMKSLAIKLNIPIILISMLNRGDFPLFTDIPHLSGFHDDNLISVADTICLLYRDSCFGSLENINVLIPKRSGTMVEEFSPLIVNLLFSV